MRINRHEPIASGQRSRVREREAEGRQAGEELCGTSLDADPLPPGDDLGWKHKEGYGRSCVGLDRSHHCKRSMGHYQECLEELIC